MFVAAMIAAAVVVAGEAYSPSQTREFLQGVASKPPDVKRQKLGGKTYIVPMNRLKTYINPLYCFSCIKKDFYASSRYPIMAMMLVGSHTNPR